VRTWGAGLLLLALISLGAVAAETPSSAYLAYRKALAGAKDIEAVFPYLSRGAAVRLRQDLERMPPGQRGLALQLIQEMMPRDVTILRTKLRDANATLLVRGAVDNPLTPDKRLTMSYGTVTMVREDGRWRFVVEKWESVKPRATPTPGR